MSTSKVRSTQQLLPQLSFFRKHLYHKTSRCSSHLEKKGKQKKKEETRRRELTQLGSVSQSTDAGQSNSFERPISVSSW